MDGGVKLVRSVDYGSDEIMKKWIAILCAVIFTPGAAAADVSCELFQTIEIDNSLPRAYQTAIADINGDGKPDIAALGEGKNSRVSWYENPSWKLRPISGNKTTDHIDFAFLRS